MATVYRKTVTRALPNDAQLFTRKGEQLARWRDRKGGRRTGAVVEGRDGSQRVRIESATYVAKYRDGSGVVREVSTGCRTKDAAQAVLRELVERAEKVRAGVVSATEDAVRDWLAEPVAELLAEYLNGLRSKRRSESHIEDCRRLNQRLFRECGFNAMREIAAAPVERWLAARSDEGMAPRTRNSYLQALRGFCRWCVEAGRLAADPTGRIGKLDEATDRRIRRRSMTADELRRMLYVARWRPLAEYGRQTVAKDASKRTGKRDTWKLAPLSFDELPAALELAQQRLAKNPDFLAKLDARGRNRSLVYKTLVLTGLRRGELASLTVGSLSLESEPAYLTLEAGNAKNHQRAEIPLREDLADDLRLWLSEKRAAHCGETGESVGVLSLATGEPARMPAATPLFDVPRQLVKALDRDLAAAGIAKRDDRGHTLDVHALRHSFGSLLSAGGVAPRTAQAALRHSSIDLTMNVYTDPRVLDVAGALGSLPSLPLGGSPNDRQQLRATGTSDHRAADPEPKGFVAPTVAPNSENWCNEQPTADRSDGSPPWPAHEKTPTKQAVSRGLQRVAEGSRTPDLRNHNPAL